MIYTKEYLAALLNGREYGDEITDIESALAKSLGLVVVFGGSDDLAELRGAIYDEVSGIDGFTFYVSPLGVVMEPDEDEAEVLERFKVLHLVTNKTNEIEACWCKEPLYPWTYKTTIPHATFNILENGEKYCRGIVFSIADIKG